MSVAHHPSEAVIAQYAAGTLADGPSLAAAAHLERCGRCRAQVMLFEAVGGVLIEELPPAAMHDDALALALAKIERPPPPSPLGASAPRRAGPDGIVLPAALARRGVGPRRFVGPGVWVAPVRSNSADGWRTYLLRAPPGVIVPHHGHNGAEYTVVISGAFRDESGLYAVGDFAEADEGVEHHPAAEGQEACVCLISGEGGVRASGLLRLIQPFLGV